MNNISNPEVISFESASVEKIDDGIAFIAEGIEITDGMWEEIKRSMQYMPNANELGRPLRFDYVNLATDEIAEDPNDQKSMLREFRSEKGRSWLARSIFYWLSPKARQIREDYIKGKKKERIRNLDEGIRQPYLSKKGQKFDYSMTRGRISRMVNDPNLLSAINAIGRNPEKPFLIVYGHGGAMGKDMGVGEAYGKQVNLRKVLERMNVQSNKYSLIILERCNSAGLQPPILSDKTPIYYVKEGLAGFLYHQESGFIDPSM